MARAMCGIAGFERRGDDGREVAGVALECLANRGPDGGWWHELDTWVLAQTRLAVIDLSERVRYPMPNETRDVWLVFNGEIYNHRDLRAELQRLGHEFATRCDAEVLVHGYEQWGTGLYGRLRGMWAAAIADERSGILLLARDALGIKPLVRTTRGRFGFASDALTLIRTGLSAGEIDPAAVDAYLAFHYVPEPGTGLADVEHVEPGTYIRRDRDGAETVHRWAPSPFQTTRAAGRIGVDEADGVLRSAVARQLEADVDVGVFLSGGIDSSLVMKYAVEAGARPLAITIGFAGSGGYDEAAVANNLCAELGVRHVIEDFDPRFDDTIAGIGRAYDAPLADPSAIATLSLAKVAREHVTVALSGTGGDDLFAGYYRHRAHLLRRAADAVPVSLRHRLATASLDRGAEHGTPAKLARSYVTRFARSWAPTDADQYLALIGSSTSERALRVLASAPDVHAARARLADRFGGSEHRPWLDVLQAFELTTYLQGDLLQKEDRATMAFGLENRVPLLDEEVLELASRTPVSQRASLRGGKLLLRAVARRRLPEGYARRRKHGFGIPLRRLLDGPWRTDASDWLREQPSTLVRARDAAGLVGRPDVPALDVWTLIALCAWEHRVVEARRAATRLTAPWL